MGTVGRVKLRWCPLTRWWVIAAIQVTFPTRLTLSSLNQDWLSVLTYYMSEHCQLVEFTCCFNLMCLILHKDCLLTHVITLPEIKLVTFGISVMILKSLGLNLAIFVFTIMFICYLTNDTHNGNTFKRHWALPNGCCMLNELKRRISSQTNNGIL